MRWVFGATPIIALQLIGAAYFQAIGKVRPALWLTLLRQGILFIPLLFLFASLYGEIGVWQSFFVADVLATVITGYFLFKEVQKTLLNR
jgi:Na+-driven multidrug efflux pump